MTGAGDALSETNRRISGTAAANAAATGSLLLEGTNNAGECTPRDTDERDSHSKQRDHVRFEANRITSANICTQRNRGSAAATATIAGRIRAATESVPDERDRNDFDAVEVLLLTVDVLHAERG